MNPTDQQVLFELHRARGGAVEFSHLPTSELNASHRRLTEAGFSIARSSQERLALESAPSKLIADDLAARLKLLSPAAAAFFREILVFESTASTNDLVHQFGRQGSGEGRVVYAESQTSGRGRHGRRWISPPLKGLWFSILLRPPLKPEQIFQINVITGVALVRALESVSLLNVQIKWPNDLLHAGRKLGGLLVESQLDQGRIDFVTLGIGLNVFLETGDFPEELQARATSVRCALPPDCAASLDRSDLAVSLLASLFDCYQKAVSGGYAELLAEWKRYEIVTGRRVRVHSNSRGELTGIVKEVTSEGALRLETDDGGQHVLTEGEVTLTP
jgi:BirA family transcriptional regulator, biotin operon repressor / biotin---[acetyl-CoA-carboxylase] ligase